MPYGEPVYPPITETGYYLSATTEVEGSVMTGFDIVLNQGMFAAEPSAPGVWDEWFQSLVDYIAAFPSVTSVSAGKGATGTAVICTPTEEEPS